MAKLTPKQQQIYDYILSFAEEHGYPPSVREIAQAVGLKSPATVHFHLKGLREAGCITQAEGKTRAGRWTFLASVGIITYAVRNVKRSF